MDAFAGAAFEKFASRKNNVRASARSEKLLQLIPEQFLEVLIEPKRHAYDCLMNIIDFVCGMTDSFAVAMFKKISGISLP